jgi:DNA ligase (NAD+)
MSSSLRAEWERLSQVIAYHDDLYFNKQSPELPDDAYDVLKRRFLWLSSKLGREATQVGSAPSINALPQITHDTKMLSIDSEVGEQSLNAFLEKLERQFPDSTYPIIAQHKIDGLAVSVKYIGGKLVYCATRGDGIVGEDVTFNARRLFPTMIKTDCKELCVRGEIYIPTQTFQDSTHGFVTARNAASGILRNTHSAHQDMLHFLAYELHAPGFELYTDATRCLTQLGFDVLPGVVCNSRAACIEVYHDTTSMRDNIDYQIDGVVFKVNALPMRAELGQTARAPRWAFACKFPPQESVAQVKHITFQTGRTGIVTPVVEITPVLLGGATVSRSSMHNVQMLREHDLRIGDSIVIARAGDVIPYVQKVLYDLRPPDTKVLAIPTLCPSCGGELCTQDRFLKCEAGWDCPEQVVWRVDYFLKCLQIKSLSIASLRKFYSIGLVRSIADLYELKGEDVGQVEGWGERSWVKLRHQLSTPVPLSGVIAGLGIDGVGKVTAEVLAAEYKSWDAFCNATLDSLRQLRGVGDVVADNIYTALHKQRKMFGEVVRHLSIKHECATTAIESWVITGTFPTPRNQIVAKLKSVGINVTPAVSRNTSKLLCGDKPGSKLADARRLGIDVIGLDELNSLIL